MNKDYYTIIIKPNTGILMKSLTLYSKKRGTNYMDSNFSPKVKEIISYSREEALRLGNDFIGTEHLLLGLIREGDGLAVRVLQSMHVDLFDLRKEVEMAGKDKTSKSIANIKSLPLT